MHIFLFGTFSNGSCTTELPCHINHVTHINFYKVEIVCMANISVMDMTFREIYVVHHILKQNLLFQNIFLVVYQAFF